MKCFLGLMFVLMAATTMAEPIEWPVGEGGNGHWYEKFDVGEYPGMTWRQMEQFAESLEHNGMSGHLVTITSTEEFHHVRNVRDNLGIGYRVYVGAWNMQPLDPDLEDNPGWRWITGEDFDQTVIPNQAWGITDRFTGALSFSCGPYSHSWLCDWGHLDPDNVITENGCFIIEYDNDPVINPLPEIPVALESSSWGALKSVYR